MAEPEDSDSHINIGEAAAELIHCHSPTALSSISLTNGPGENGRTVFLVERQRERGGVAMKRGEGELRRRHGGREVEVKGQQLVWRCSVNKARAVSVGFDGSHKHTNPF